MDGEVIDEEFFFQTSFLNITKRTIIHPASLGLSKLPTLYIYGIMGLLWVHRIE
jgi:hypothetical protein